MSLLSRISSSVERGDIYTLPQHGFVGRSPAVLLRNQEDGDGGGEQGDDGGIGWGGLTISPAASSVANSESYDSYNNASMSFYVTPTYFLHPKFPAPTVNLVSPITGSYQYVVLDGRWVCMDDGHSLEGLLVRDMIRVFGGMLQL